MQAKLAWGLLALVALVRRHAGRGRGTRLDRHLRDPAGDGRQRSTRLVVECTGPVAYTYYSPDPLTLVVDMPEVDPSKVPARINVGTPRGGVGAGDDHGPSRRPHAWRASRCGWPASCPTRSSRATRA